MNVEQILAELTKASNDDLTAALAAVRESASKVDTSAGVTEETVAELERYAAAKTAIEGQLAKNAELADRAAAAQKSFAADDSAPAEPADEPKDDEPKDEPKTDDPAAPAEPVVDPTRTDPPPPPAEPGEPLTASAKLGTIGKQKDAAVKQFAGVVTGTTRYVGGQGALAVGTQLDWDKLTEAFESQWGSVSAAGMVGKFLVARVETNYPEARTLSRDDGYSVNRKKISDAKSPEALTAAGGLCAPLETRYDINVLGITDRPVRDALTRFTVARGGIQYRPPIDALALTDGQGIWTAEMDAAVGVVETPTDVPDPVKTCAVVDCPAVEDAIVDAIYLCLQFSNFTSRFDREFVDSTTRAALVAHARFAENNLLSKLLAGSKLLTQAKTVSATRDVLVAIDKTVAYYRNRHRLDTMVPLRMILPRWVLDLFRADIARGLGSAHDDAMLGIADAAIMGFFRNRGVNVSFHLDGLGAATVGSVSIPQQFYSNATAGQTIPGFIDKIDAVLFAEGDWMFLDGGTLDLGMVRDSQLNSINRYQTFVENWEGVAFDGIESLRLVLEVQPTSMVGGTLDLSTLAD